MKKFKTEKCDWLFLAGMLVLSFFYPLSASDLSFEETASTGIYDRNGYLLREILSPQQGRGHWVTLDRISLRAIEAAVIAEDKRFYLHAGVDVWALMRAAWQNVQAMEIVSGGSTITQQVVRNLYHFPRHPAFKLLEMWYAVRLEHTLDKSKILERYFNIIPFGNQTFGIDAAARLYFGTSSAELTWSEAAFLIALPKSPTFYNPYKNSVSATNRRDFILKKLHESEKISGEEFRRALKEPILLFPKSSPFNAPHFCDYIMQQNPDAHGDIRTTLDWPLQKEIETIVSGQIRNLSEENVTNAAVIVIHNATGHILAMLGSADYFNVVHDGQFNAVFSKRQPGSALKPFTYGAAFQQGYTPATVIPDVETVVPTAQGNFTPKNYDNHFHGPVRARIALACSYNVAAVRVLQTLGVSALLSKLHECGMHSLNETAEYYGHGLTLGNGEVTLFELARAYGALANQGQWMDVTGDPQRIPLHTSKEIFSPQVAFLISSILSDASARVPSFGYDSPITLPFPCAVKTGTSSDFRDNWTVGYTRDFTVGVWAGNFDNRPMKNISGVTGAGPIFREIMLALHRQSVPENFPVPAKIRKMNICGLSGELPNAGCTSTLEEYFVEGTEPKGRCRWHSADGLINYAAFSPIYGRWLQNKNGIGENPSAAHTEKKLDEVKSLKIIYPNDEAVFKIDPNVRIDYQAIYFEALVPAGIHEIRWQLDGRFYQTAASPFRVRWNLSAGKHRLRADYVAGEKTFSSEVGFEVMD